MNLTLKLLLFLLILKESVSLEVNTKIGKIAGGYEARPHSNPYVVSLQSRFRWSWYRLCGGAILGERWILSAGHCVTDSWARRFPMDAIVGAHNLARISSSQIYPISHRIAHPMYRGGVGPYDIAMMRTARKIKFSDKVQPIRLPRRAPIFRRNEELLITSWGALKSNIFVKVLPNKLQQVEVTYLPYYECYRAINRIKDKYDPNPLKRTANICTGPIYAGISGCTGDSGGPLVKYVSIPSEVDSMPSITTGKEESTTTMASYNKDSTSTTSATTTKSTTTATPTAETTTDGTSTDVTITTESDTSAITTESEIMTETATATELYNRNTNDTSNSNRIRIDNLRAWEQDKLPYVVGVISWGVVPCGERGAPTVYSNVTNYLDFIHEYLYSD